MDENNFYIKNIYLPPICPYFCRWGGRLNMLFWYSCFGECHMLVSFSLCLPIIQMFMMYKCVVNIDLPSLHSFDTQILFSIFLSFSFLFLFIFCLCFFLLLPLFFFNYILSCQLLWNHQYSEEIFGSIKTKY